MINDKGKQYQVTNNDIVWDGAKNARLKVLKQKETPICQIAKIFGCKDMLIHRRLRVLNLTENKWTTVQDRILRDNYLEKDNQEIATMINGNPVYVGDRLTYLGLLRPRGRKAKKKT